MTWNASLVHLREWCVQLARSNEEKCVSRVELRKMSKQFGERTVVNEVDLVAEQGEVVVLLGPSGCGKTSTLRMIAGLESITSGELYFDDRLMNAEPPDRRSIGMVFQNYALYPHMSVFDNLAFGLESQSKTGTRSERRKSISERVTETAELLEIGHLLHQRPRQLSGGQRQRVSLGRALVRKPDVFLMDEPLSNLDANLRDRMRMELARLHQVHGITTLYVTHDQGEALTLADRIVVMNQGSVCQIGTPSDLYDHPSSAFVANFIGMPGMNLWTSQWESKGTRIQCGPATTLHTDFRDVLATKSRSIAIGVRPEHLHLIRSEQVESSGLTTQCRVDLVERLGSHLLAHCSMEAEAGSIQTSLVARLDSESQIERGDYLLLAAPLHRVHLFDAGSGDRIEHFSSVAALA